MKKRIHFGCVFLLFKWLKMNDIDCLYLVTPSKKEETETFLNKFYAFNLKPLNLPAETDFISLTYVTKHNEKIISGISSFFLERFV